MSHRIFFLKNIAIFLFISKICLEFAFNYFCYILSMLYTFAYYSLNFIFHQLNNEYIVCLVEVMKDVCRCDCLCNSSNCSLNRCMHLYFDNLDWQDIISSSSLCSAGVFECPEDRLPLDYAKVCASSSYLIIFPILGSLLAWVTTQPQIFYLFTICNMNNVNLVLTPTWWLMRD